jgi:uncharacterized protein (TIGR02300 family)
MPHIASCSRNPEKAVKAFDTRVLLWQLARIVDKTNGIKRGLPMPKEEWGTKRVCPTTGKRFYDLNKNPIVSPYTGEVVEVDTGKSRMIAADAEDAATKKMREAETDSDSEVLDDDVDVELDDDLLDDDDDDNVSLDELADVPADDDES